MKQLLITVMIAMWTTGALAHSPLEATIPANEATVSEMPSEVIMDFKGDIRLTKVKMTHADQPSVDLDLDNFSGFISTYTIPLQFMGAGVYVIGWRGLSADGHVLNGSFSFIVE